MKKENVLQVVEQLVSMLNVNIKDTKYGYHTFGETFEGWCEDGDVFYEENSKENAMECEEIMKDISAEINDLMGKLEKYIN